MSQTEINRKIQIMFFENADAAQIRSIIGEQFTSGSLQDVIDTLNCILDAQLSMLQFEAVISALEDQFLINHLDFLCKYLFVLNDRYGKEHMARFYLDLCNTTQYLPPFYDEEDFNQRVKKYAHPDRVCFSSKYYKNDFNQEYIFEGKSKSYSVYSFSDEIGQNLTLLTTPYGDIIFDCGAKYNKDGAQVICKEEFLRFLSMSNSSVGNIIAVIISHAHMDHYGSLSTLINSGINPHIVFIGEGEDRIKLSSLVTKYGITERAWFYGACYDERTNAELLYNADLCVIPGDIGLTAIHAMTMGIPVISHNCFKYQGPEFESIIPGRTGDFFEYDNVDDLAHCISQWFATKRNAREQVRQACYAEIDKHWNPYYQLKVLKSVFEAKCNYHNMVSDI